MGEVSNFSNIIGTKTVLIDGKEYAVKVYAPGPSDFKPLSKKQLRKKLKKERQQAKVFAKKQEFGSRPTGAMRNQKKMLEFFWSSFGGHNGKLKPEKAIRIEWLQRYADVVLFCGNQNWREKQRGRQAKLKPIRWYIWKHPVCWACGAKAQVRHHIIQLQNGGLTSKLNITGLCFACHAEVHPWLKK